MNKPVWITHFPEYSHYATNISNSEHCENPVLICPHCQTKVEAENFIDVIYFRKNDDKKDRFENDSDIDKLTHQVVRCPSCERPFIYEVETDTTIPGFRPFEDVKHLPDNVDTIYNENREAYAAKCYTASLLLSRAVLVYVAVDNGLELKSNGKSPTFEECVNFFEQQNLMPAKAKSWVDKIRLLGNEAAHELKTHTAEEAKTAITYLMYLLKYVYELPNEV